MRVGYARSSTLEQQAGYDAQVEKLKATGCERVFGEMVSSMSERAQLDAALEFVREGDTFIVTAASRLARSTKQLLEIHEELQRKRVTLQILDLNIDTANPTGRLMLTLIAGICQWEREVMLERQMIGITLAKRQGKFKGRVPTARRQADKVLALKAAGRTPSDIVKEMGISRASVYRILQEARPTG
jgi:DNA invertase Pin-like site-specific DNA recombinase